MYFFFNPYFAHYLSFRPHAWCDIIGVYNTSICNVPRCGIILTNIEQMHSFHDNITSFSTFVTTATCFYDSCPFYSSYNVIIIMIGHRNRFIHDVDLSESTSLTHLLNRHTKEDDEDVETQ